LISIPIIFNAINDPRWNSLIETIPIAFDTDTNMHWSDRSKKLPKLSNGEPVSGSNYLRLAWLAKSLEYIKKEPLIGIGYGRNSFGHAIQKYEGIDSARGKHSHSGILDFTISTGLIGLMLWLVFIGLIVAFSLKRFLIDSSYFALVSFFITTGFFFRSIVDSIMRDHVFQQFMLMLGIFLAFLVYEQISKTQSS
jgi:O-antigen ligase